MRHIELSRVICVYLYSIRRKVFDVEIDKLSCSYHKWMYYIYIYFCVVRVRILRYGNQQRVEVKAPWKIKLYSKDWYGFSRDFSPFYPFRRVAHYESVTLYQFQNQISTSRTLSRRWWWQIFPKNHRCCFHYEWASKTKNFIWVSMMLVWCC